MATVCQLQMVNETELSVCECQYVQPDCMEGEELICQKNEDTDYETCTCEIAEEACPPVDIVCQNVTVNGVLTEECFCIYCEDKDRICALEDVDGEQQKVCRCQWQVMNFDIGQDDTSDELD